MRFFVFTCYFTANAQVTVVHTDFENYISKIRATSSRYQWVNAFICRATKHQGQSWLHLFFIARILHIRDWVIWKWRILAQIQHWSYSVYVYTYWNCKSIYLQSMRIAIVIRIMFIYFLLKWRHNWRNGVSNHQPHDCLLNCLFSRRSKKTSKLRVSGRCEGNSPVTNEFPA